MIWKKYSENYEISSAGLFRRRKGTKSHPVGLMMSPNINRYGSPSYSFINGEGKKAARTIDKMMQQVFDKNFVKSEHWVDTIKMHVARYNAHAFGHASKYECSKEEPMWNYKKFGCPWDAWQSNIYGHHTMADLCPVI